jgi:hypothetical protein
MNAINVLLPEPLGPQNTVKPLGRSRTS